jgi:membrane-associated phospholipid phosphatase
MSVDPWFSSLNYELFRFLFSHIPPSNATEDWCGTLISNSPLSCWIFAFCFYHFWTINDSQKLLRRRYLIDSTTALGLGITITIVLRPWVHWPAPVLNKNFQTLFPQHLWGNGNGNCFPSHSTLVYFTIAVGFWRLSRSLSVALAVVTLAFISFPRVYEGGHYPIDVAFSCGLTISTLLLVRHWPVLGKISNWLAEDNSPAGPLRQLVLFGWLFELADGFHSVEFLFGVAHHMFAPLLL